VSPFCPSLADKQDLLLKKIDHAVHIVLKVVDCLLVGVLDLVTSLLLVLGIKLNNLLGCLLGSKSQSLLLLVLELTFRPLWLVLNTELDALFPFSE
jgi:hypothetical protein